MFIGPVILQTFAAEIEQPILIIVPLNVLALTLNHSDDSIYVKHLLIKLYII